MISSTPGSRSGSPRSGGGGGPGSGSGGGGSVSLTLLSSAAQNTATAVAGAVFAALPSCSMPEAFTSEEDFEDYLQQFTTAARLSGWQAATTDNRPNYFALRLKGNALHFYTTFTVAQQRNFDQLVAVFRTTYTTIVEVLQTNLKTARQQPNQTIAPFLCNVKTLARRVYRRQPPNKWSSLVSSKVFTMPNSDGNFEKVNQPVQVLLWPSQSNCMFSWRWISVSEVGSRPQ